MSCYPQKLTPEIILLLLFSHSVVSDSLWPHGLQHARLPCPWPSPRVCSNSYPSSQWCHPIISFSVIPFSFCLQSFPASGSFPMGQLFASGGQSIRDSASASILPINSQHWFPLRLTGLISSLSKGLSRGFSSTFSSSKASVLWCLAFFIVQFSYLYMPNHSFDYMDLLGKVKYTIQQNKDFLIIIFTLWWWL